MKLHCLAHHRRVVVLESGVAVHRNGDGDRCASDLQIGVVVVNGNREMKDQIIDRPARRLSWSVKRRSYG